MSTTTAESTTWRCTEPGLWIASASDGRPVGIVSERWMHGFVVTAVNGRDLGMHPTFDQAKAALESALATA